MTTGRHLQFLSFRNILYICIESNAEDSEDGESVACLVGRN